MNKKRLISGLSALILAFSQCSGFIPITDTSITSYALTSPRDPIYIEKIGKDGFIFDEDGNIVETVAEAAERLAKEKITADMTTYEIVEEILYFVSKTMNSEDYSCWAAAQDVAYICAYFDIPCNTRTAGATDFGNGANHMNNVISIDGVSYIADASLYKGDYRLDSCESYWRYNDQKGFSDGDYSYYLNDDGTATIDSCFIFGAEELTFPTEVNGYPITEIGRIEFADSNSIVSLNIPDGLSLTDGYNFALLSGEFENLETVSLGDEVTELPIKCLLGCEKLKNINLSNITALRDASLCETGIEYADLSKATILEDGALNSCPNLKEVKLSDELTYIPIRMFGYCSSLEDITIPESVTEIQDYAFAKCSNLILDVPDTVKTFGTDCFNGVKLIRCNYGSAAQKYCSVNNIPYECYDAPNIGDVTTVKTYSSPSKADKYEITDTTYTYNGTRKNIYINVYDEDGNKVDPMHYDYEITNDTNAGNAVVTITGKSGYSGTKTVLVKINPYDISKGWSNSFLFAKIPTYTGSEVEAIPKEYTLFNNPLVENVDYTLSYSNNINAGSNTAKCIVTGIGNYTGSFVKTFSINQASLSNVEISIPDQEYKGTTVIPKTNISYNGKTLKENVDYTVEYTNNSSVGYAYAVFTGIGNFKGSKTVRFAIKKHVHSYGDWTIDEEPTCTKEGSKSRVCTGCGVSETVKIDKTEHKMSNYVIVEPTCTKEGSKTRTCTVCGYTEREVLSKTAHTMGDYVINKEPTCKEEGSKSRSCTVCGLTETEVLPKTDHKMSDNYNVVEPTCTEKGYTEHFCDSCGEEVKDNYTDALGHSFGSWVTTKPADCQNTGIQERTCSRCSETETKVIAKKAHSYKTTVVSPTYAAQGYTLHKCSNCGYSYKDKYTAKKTVQKVVPTTFSCSASAIKINWNKVTDAAGYKVYRYNTSTKKWDTIASITNGSTLYYKQSGLKVPAQQLPTLPNQLQIE